LAGKRSDARYASDACRLGAWKAQHNRTAENGYLGRSQGVGKRLNAQTRRGGLQLSYYKTFKAFTALTGLEDHEIERALRAALSDRQRAELDLRATRLGR
jgi:hypothetical protein